MSVERYLCCSLWVHLVFFCPFLLATTGCESEPPLREMTANEFMTTCNAEGICDGSTGVSWADGPYLICRCLESGKTYRKFTIDIQSKFKADIVSQKWTGLKAGTKVSFNDGLGAVEHDVFGSEVSLNVTNTSSQRAHIFPPVYLVGEDELPIQIFRLREGEIVSDLPKEGLPVEPNETRLITFDSVMGPMDAYENSGLFYIACSDWKVELKPIRSGDISYK